MRAYTHTNIPHAPEKLISALEEVVGSSKLHVYVDATTGDVQAALVVRARMQVGVKEKAQVGHAAKYAQAQTHIITHVTRSLFSFTP